MKGRHYILREIMCMPFKSFYLLTILPLFAAFCAVFGRCYAVIELKLLVKVSYAFEPAGVAYLHHSVICGAQ